MLLLRTREALKRWRNKRESVGFVPTMGALHEGHISLVRESKRRQLTTLVSIFVNPTQFNNPEDLKKYPRDEEGDLQKLEAAGCDAVFMPEKGEVYPKGTTVKTRYKHDFGHLEKVFEGAFRPGHFRGVGEVVHIFFELVEPQVAFFGEKDYQQLLIMRKLVRMLGLDIQVAGMPTVREKDGLAMSSRNLRLSEKQRSEAALLYRSLQLAKSGFGPKKRSVICGEVAGLFAASPEMELEYFDIVDEETLKPLEQPEKGVVARALISAYAGEIRLIDNLRIG